MKFQSFNTAWKKEIPKVAKEVVKIVEEVKLPVLNTKDIVLPKEEALPITTPVVVHKPQENVEKPQEIVEKQEEAVEKENNTRLISYKPQTFQDYIIITLIIIIFLLFLWNLNSIQEMKRLYQTQDKILNLLLQRLLKE